MKIHFKAKIRNKDNRKKRKYIELPADIRELVSEGEEFKVTLDQ